MAMVLVSLKKKSLKAKVIIVFGYSQSNQLFLMSTTAVTKIMDQFAMRETQITQKKKIRRKEGEDDKEIAVQF